MSRPKKKSSQEIKSVLDPSCGSRKFYFDKKSEVVLYGDIREDSYVQCDGRTLEIAPDQQMDVTDLPFEDESFSLVIFDPPHLRNVGESSYMGQAYGRLPPDVAKFLKSGFDECWRVLKPNGTLIFKWGAKDFKLPFVLQTIGRKPLLGNRKPATETYWMVFFKSQDVKNEIPT